MLFFLLGSLRKIGFGWWVGCKKEDGEIAVLRPLRKQTTKLIHHLFVNYIYTISL
jgi:hypothetical protein